ncbi:hypothetical protein [Caulobacter hibisci]|uniref:Uncharacterized protein n=1 Tax=Caulobacter hibisci TaxID=2035993 RepID=A0ABS0SRN8_9CAUL|nr:hypothetical protein [Caulobacter hibisci]MBI1682285.1 hypothetical protein [Caulobacter hibisci]
MLATTIATLKTAGRVTEADVVALRGLVYPDMVLSRAEAQALLALDEAVEEASTPWRHLLTEAIVDHLVHQARPAGYVDAEAADWLIAAVSRDGLVKSATELEVLIRVLETASEVPEALVAFTLAQVKAAVLHGQGPLAQGRMERGRVTDGEAALLRRVLYAQAGDENIAITRAEAEILFDINDASVGARNASDWTELFAKAVAASVMTVSHYRAPSRQEAARHEAWLAQPADVPGFLARMFQGAPGVWRTIDNAEALNRIMNPDREIHDAWEARNREQAAVALAAETIDAEEAAWLVERLERDGVLDAAESALLAFIARESPQVHPALAAVIARAKAQAEARSPKPFGRRG